MSQCNCQKRGDWHRCDPREHAILCSYRDDFIRIIVCGYNESHSCVVTVADSNWSIRSNGEFAFGPDQEWDANMIWAYNPLSDKFGAYHSRA